jgi:glycine dehydrogenase subunit 1
MNYISHSTEDITKLKNELSISEVSDLFKDIPEEIIKKSEINIKQQFDNLQITDHIKNLCKLNSKYELSFCGGGFYNHYVPAVVDELSSRTEFYTSYTPYQAEISQGYLQVMFEYQSLMCRLTKMDVSNSSLYDGATALAEAVIMATKQYRKKQPKVLIYSLVNPSYKQVLKSYLKYIDCDISFIPYNDSGQIDLEYLENELKKCNETIVVMSQPNYLGIIENLNNISNLKAKYNFQSILSVYPFSLGLLKAPGDYNFDIVTGEGQSLGNYLYFGGPQLGIITAKQKYIRSMPGRIVGETVDKNNKRAWTLTLQTREQHIRRDKATSNICSNQALCALRTAIYLTYIGENGFKQISKINHLNAEYLKEKFLSTNQVKLKFDSATFNEFVVEFPNYDSLENFYNDSLNKNIIPGIKVGKYYPELNNCLLITSTEMHKIDDLDKFIEKLCV